MRRLLLVLLLAVSIANAKTAPDGALSLAFSGAVVEEALITPPPSSLYVGWEFIIMDGGLAPQDSVGWTGPGFAYETGRMLYQTGPKFFYGQGGQWGAGGWVYLLIPPNAKGCQNCLFTGTWTDYSMNLAVDNSGPVPMFNYTVSGHAHGTFTDNNGSAFQAEATYIQSFLPQNTLWPGCSLLCGMSGGQFTVIYQ